MWNSIVAGGLSAGILALRGGFKVFAYNFIQGAVLLGLIEGLSIMISSYSAKKLNALQMELYGLDGSTL